MLPWEAAKFKYLWYFNLTPMTSNVYLSGNGRENCPLIELFQLQSVFDVVHHPTKNEKLEGKKEDPL